MIHRRSPSQTQSQISLSVSQSGHGSGHFPGRADAAGPMKPRMEAFMMKCGGKVKTWKSRYFRLTGDYLEYYKDDAPEAPKLGSIYIPGSVLAIFAINVVHGHEYCFGVTPMNDTRQYVIEADNAKQRMDWILALRPFATNQSSSCDSNPTSLTSPPHRAHIAGFASVTHSNSLNSLTAARKFVSNSIREGYLTKQGAVRQNWKRRFFVLIDKKLIYYKTFEDLSKAQGELDLSAGYILSTPKDGEIDEKTNVFSVQSMKTGRKLIMYADNHEDRRAWVHIIRTIPGEKKGEQPPPKKT